MSANSLVSRTWSARGSSFPAVPYRYTCDLRIVLDEASVYVRSTEERPQLCQRFREHSGLEGIRIFPCDGKLPRGDHVSEIINPVLKPEAFLQLQCYACSAQQPQHLVDIAGVLLGRPREYDNVVEVNKARLLLNTREDDV